MCIELCICVYIYSHTTGMYINIHTQRAPLVIYTCIVDMKLCRYITVHIYSDTDTHAHTKHDGVCHVQCMCIYNRYIVIYIYNFT